jgi:hypothetical protein
MSELSEQQVIRLAMSPLYVIYAVASAQFAPEKITRRQIIKAVEYGLTCEQSLGERIFELLKMNLHEFYARFPREFPECFVETCLQELGTVRQLLGEACLPPEMTADFKCSLRRLALFVAAGSIFGPEVPLAAMETRAEKIAAILE